MPTVRGRSDEERAAGIAYVLIVSAVLLVFLTTIVSLLSKEMKWLVGTQKRNMLLTAADGGLDRALYALQTGGNWDNLPKAIVAGYNQDVTYTDLPGIRYTIKVQEGNWTPGFQIGDTKLERTVTVFATHTISGERRKVQVVIMQTTLSSALFSAGQISIMGNAAIHWGPVVSYSTASDSIPFNADEPPNSPTFMSKGGITFKGASAGSKGLNSNDPMAGKTVCENCDSIVTQPVIPVDEWRQISKAQSAGATRYFGGAGTCPSPLLNKAVWPATDDNSITFFDTSTAQNFVYGTHTVDPKNCGTPATNIGAEVKTSGNFCGNGILVVMGNLDMAGNGCALGVNLIPPPDCYPKYDEAGTDCSQQTNPSDLTWNGLIYIAGVLSYSGNIKIYGTIDAVAQASTKGSMSIYYKTASKSLGYLGKSIFQKIWLERKPEPGDIFP